MTHRPISEYPINDTVFALSTPVGGAIAVIRASGALCLPVLERIFTGGIRERMLSSGRLCFDGETVDECMAVFFKGPRSYTGEDMFEIDLHGSYAVVKRVMDILSRLGLRPAEPGEFTRRAFLNGKLDLVQADAVMDLINAETDRSASAALDQLRGGLSRRIADAERVLIDLLGELSAAMDYPDEMEDETLSSVPETLGGVIAQFDELIKNGRASRLLRDGAKAVILGLPNAGKSSLMNALLGADRAIVTDIAGTTRDTLEEKLNILGLSVRLVDTAGIRQSVESPVERIGIARALDQADSAQTVLFVLDGTKPSPSDEELALIGDIREESTVFVINKCDLAPETCLEYRSALKARFPNVECVVISAKTGAGLEVLKQAVAKRLGASDVNPLITNTRHIALIERARDELAAAMLETDCSLASTVIASALSALSEITGREFSEELLDNIFSRFCVGK